MIRIVALGAILGVGLIACGEPLGGADGGFTDSGSAGGGTGSDAGGADAGAAGFHSVDRFELYIYRADRGDVSVGTGGLSSRADSGTAASCTVLASVNGCERTDCVADGGTIQVAPVNAGTVNVSSPGGSMAFVWNASTGYTPTGISKSLFVDGALVTETAQGGADIPSFTLSTRVPNVPRIVGPATPNGQATLSSSSGFSVALNQAASAPFVFDISASRPGNLYQRVHCEFPRGPTQFTVPGAVLSGMSGPVYLYPAVTSAAETTVNGFHVRFSVETIPILADGGYLNSGVIQ